MVVPMKRRRVTVKNPFDAIGEVIGQVVGKIVQAIAGEMIQALAQGFIDAIFNQNK